MKKFLPFLSLAFFITACTSKPAETETKTIQSAQQTTGTIDTAGLSAFQQWKAQNELGVATPPQQEVQPVAQAPVRTVTVIREVRVQQPAPARKTVRQQTPAPVQERSTPAPVEEAQPVPAGTGDVASSTGSGNSTADAPAPQAETAKKEGMSNAGKGAVIGSAGGAVVGAVLNKRNRGAGAVIGGVIGGAVGYGLGKKKDKKESQQ